MKGLLTAMLLKGRKRSVYTGESRYGGKAGGGHHGVGGALQHAAAALSWEGWNSANPLHPKGADGRWAVGHPSVGVIGGAHEHLHELSDEDLHAMDQHVGTLASALTEEISSRNIRAAGLRREGDLTERRRATTSALFGDAPLMGSHAWNEAEKAKLEADGKPDLGSMKVAELRAHAASKGISTTGLRTKKEILDRLRSHETMAGSHEMLQRLGQANTPAPHEQRVRDAYAALQRHPGDWVPLADLRERLPGLSRAEQDAALKGLATGKPDVFIIPWDNRLALRPRDHEASFRFGGDDNHAIRIESPTPAPALQQAAPAAKPLRATGGKPVPEDVLAALKDMVDAPVREDRDRMNAMFDKLTGAQLKQVSQHFGAVHPGGRVADQRTRLTEHLIGHKLNHDVIVNGDWQRDAQMGDKTPQEVFDAFRAGDQRARPLLAAKINELAEAKPDTATESKIRDVIHHMTVPELKALRRELRGTVAQTSTGKQQIRDDIVEGTVGFRARAGAMRQGLTPGELFGKQESHWSGGANITAADLGENPFGPAAMARRAAVQDDLRKAIKEIRPSDWHASTGYVSLADVREKMPHVSRTDLDRELKAMGLGASPELHIVPEANQKTLTARLREAGITLGGEVAHHVRLERRGGQ